MVIHFHFLYKAVENIRFMIFIFLFILLYIFIFNFLIGSIWHFLYNETCMDFVYRLYLWMVCVILFVAHHWYNIRGVIIRWRVLFMMSWVMLIGWCYFPFLFFLWNTLIWWKGKVIIEWNWENIIEYISDGHNIRAEKEHEKFIFIHK